MRTWRKIMRGVASGAGGKLGAAAASIGFMAIPFDGAEHRNTTGVSQEQKENMRCCVTKRACESRDFASVQNVQYDGDVLSQAATSGCCVTRS
jgi:hypothetical protein